MKRIPFKAIFITTIVIVILVIFIAIGIRGHHTAVMAANEAAAIKTLRTIAEHQSLYYGNHQNRSFGTFDEMLAGQLLDKRFAGTAPVVDGYVYKMRVDPKSRTKQAGFAINSDPLVTEGFGATGQNHFYLDSDSNTIRVNATQPATAADPPIGQ